MSITSPDRRTLMRLALGSLALAVGWHRAAIASELTGPVEQLHAAFDRDHEGRKDSLLPPALRHNSARRQRTFDLDTIFGRPSDGAGLYCLPTSKRR
jgi:hypothetical protein